MIKVPSQLTDAAETVWSFFVIVMPVISFAFSIVIPDNSFPVHDVDKRVSDAAGHTLCSRDLPELHLNSVPELVSDLTMDDKLCLYLWYIIPMTKKNVNSPPFPFFQALNNGWSNGKRVRIGIISRFPHVSFNIFQRFVERNMGFHRPFKGRGESLYCIINYDNNEIQNIPGSMIRLARCMPHGYHRGAAEEPGQADASWQQADSPAPGIRSRKRGKEEMT